MKLPLIKNTLGLLVFMGTLSSVANASSGTDVGYFFGIKNATFSSTANPAPTFSSATGLMAGMVAVGDMGSGALKFRSGGYYSERTAKSEVSGATSTIKFSYLDVPVTALYKMNDMVGFFAGVDLGLKINDSCSGDSTICASTTGGNYQPSSFVTSAQLGLNAKFHPNWSGEIFYELGLSDLSQYTKANALSAALLFLY
jgi:hypothetical protein